MSLTYDGTLREHLSDVVPVLDSHRLRGTFYAYPPNLVEAALKWKKAAETGHEIGNHSLMGLADQDGMLPEISPETALEDVAEGERLLEELFDDAPRSFARPAVRGFTETLNPVIPPILRASILRLNEYICSMAASQYTAARSAHDGLNKPGDILPHSVRSMLADGMDCESLCLLAEIAMSQHAWVVFVFGGLRDSDFDPDAHEGLCRFLVEQEDRLLVAPLVEIAARF